MKKRFLVLIFFAAAAFGFALDYDDLPYSNTNMETFFQQEITSFMRFQAEYDKNLYFFASASFRGFSSDYREEYIYDKYGYYPDNKNVKNNEANGLAGFQFKITDELYIPVLVNFGYTQILDNHREGEFTYNGISCKGPLRMEYENTGLFIGSGLFINTNRLKGGIYAGCNILGKSHKELMIPHEAAFSGYYSGVFNDTRKGYVFLEDDTEERPATFKFALVPLVNTSDWVLIGKVLNKILGYLGAGDTFLYAEPDKEDPKTSEFINDLNAGLNFIFNAIDFSPVTLYSQSVYKRGSYDAIANQNMYGLKIRGVISGFPLEFALEGGYRDFFAVLKYFEADYYGTEYINIGIFFPFQIKMNGPVDGNSAIGLIYQYDNIQKSKFTITFNNSFVPGFLMLGSGDNKKFSDTLGHIGMGVRARAQATNQ